ncbi:protein kinase domain-containing protein [Sorangium sp. So ce861]|uniref:serine/threonine-protein kinase n=1 Tax=Sorangium sp. So ce861 TaxID=3133323 RepID=UPI003F5E00A2
MQSGDIVEDRFVVEQLAGHGGMGAVFRARDRASQGPVAIKVLRGRADSDVARFLRETRILREIDHPRIVRYVAHGALPSGEPYLAMEWLEGEDLAVWLTRERPSYEESLDLGIAVAEALGVLHDRGIVHRDLKPSNIFLVGGRFDGVKLLDFGLARAESSTRKTATGTLLGTVSYMAPEQARGVSDLDARADVFALGCVLFELLTGAPPFAGIQAMSVLTKILFEPAPRLADRRRTMPPELDELLARMLAKLPDDRPRNGHAAAEALLELRSKSSLRGDPPLLGAPPQPRLSHCELQPAAVLLVGAPPPGSDERDDAPLEAVAAAYGAHFDRLLDLSATVLLSGATVATDLAIQAARCALAMSRHARGRRIGLSMGRSASGQLRVEPAFDRTVRLLADDAAPAPATERALIVIDEPMLGLLDTRFEVRRTSGVLVLHEERDVAAVRPLLGQPAPCFGRERELRSISGLFDDCAGQSGAQVVLVTAPPGVGKTRLGSEFVRCLRARGADVDIWTARAAPLSASSAYGMISALRRSAGRSDGRPGESLEEGARSEEGTGGFLDLVAARCAERPVLLLLDDLQWADAASIRALDRTLLRLEDRPLFLLALGRPEVHEVLPDLWDDRPMQEIRLRELPRRPAEHLVQHALGARATPQVVERISRIARGNAFLLEELIRAAGAPGGEDRPEAVIATIHARLFALDDDARRILRAASVFGETFSTGGVAALLGHLGGRSSGVPDRIDMLVEQDLVERRPGARFPGETEYAFRHALVHEAALAMLTDEDRALGHRLAAEWIEARAGEAGAAC